MQKEDLIVSTGAVESEPDYRDIPFELVAGSTPLPKKHFEDISMLPVWHQRKIGSCVGQTAGKYVQYLNFLETGKIVPISPRHLYTLAKSRDGLAGEGTYTRLMAKIVKEEGAATDAVVPTDNTLDHETFVYNRKESNLPSGTRADAQPHRTGGYAFPDITSRESIKRAIIEGHGVAISVHLGKEWYTAKNGRRSWKEKDILPLRKPTEVISGHAVFLYGYEDLPDGDTMFYFRNSWSEAWGRKGDGYFKWSEYGAQLKSAITYVDIPNTTLETVHNLPDAKSFRYFFGRDIVAGEKGDHIKALQTALMIDGSFSRDLYAQLLKEGSLGFFKPNGATQKAVLDYQIKHKVAPMAELLSLQGRRVGVKTRQMLNSHFGA